MENGRDRFNNFNSIGMYVNTLPILVDCKNQDTTSFVRHMSDLVYNVMRYNYYPFKELANKYDINSNILFQFMPDWFDNDNESMFNDIIGDQTSKDGVQRIYNEFIFESESETITPEILKSVSEKIGNKLTDEEIKIIFENASSNGKDISFEDFYKVIQNSHL